MKTTGWLLVYVLTVATGRAQDYPIAPVPFARVAVNGGFWESRLETNRTVTIPHEFRMCEQSRWVDNFATAAKTMQSGRRTGQFNGYRFNDSDVYKVMEGAAYALQTHPDPKLDRYLDSLITLVAAAQEPDGYLYTIRTIHKDSTAARDPYAGATRFSFEAGSHELYCAGHLYEAAVAHYQATGKRTLLNVAIKNAEYMMRTIGPKPGQLVVVPGHEGIELALVKLYRLTNDRRYVDFARFLIDMRGRADKRELFTDEARSGRGSAELQDHAPVVQQTEAVGHAVRAEYLYAAMTDLAALQRDTAYARVLHDLWTDVVERKQYVTGGIGAREHGEAFGLPYDLPNDAAYAETCAAVANMLWNDRLFRLTGNGKYMDVFERVLYNGFLSGVSLSGNQFFYVNPLASNGQRRPGASVLPGRESWYGTPCCPTNVARFLPALPGYAYATRGDNLFVNLFMDNTADVALSNAAVQITQHTDYPWDGLIMLTINPKRTATFALRLRIPGWVAGQPMPGKLYTYANAQPAPYTLSVNGQSVRPTLENGYAVIRRAWKRGDRVLLNLPMPVRQVVANPAVAADRNHVAFERGPVVYCAEGMDNGGRALNLTPTGPLTAEYRPDFLGGLTVLTGRQMQSANGTSGRKPLLLIPYYAWANRGAGEMAVWFGLASK